MVDHSGAYQTRSNSSADQGRTVPNINGAGHTVSTITGATFGCGWCSQLTLKKSTPISLTPTCCNAYPCTAAAPCKLRLLLLLTPWIHRPTNASTSTVWDILKDLCHTPSTDLHAVQGKHASAGHDASCSNSRVDLQTSKEAIIPTHALNLTNYQRASYTCGKGPSNKSSRVWSSLAACWHPVAGTA